MGIRDSDADQSSFVSLLDRLMAILAGQKEDALMLNRSIFVLTCVLAITFVISGSDSASADRPTAFDPKQSVTNQCWDKSRVGLEQKIKTENPRNVPRPTRAYRTDQKSSPPATGTQSHK